MSTASADEEILAGGACGAGPSEEIARLQAELRFAEETIAGLMAQLEGIARVEEERQAEIGQLQIDHREALAAAEARRRADLEEQLAAHVRRVAELEAAHAAEIAAARVAGAVEAEAQADEHRRTLAALAGEHAQAIAVERLAFEQVLSALRDDLAASERSLAEARAAFERERAGFLAAQTEQVAARPVRIAEPETRIAEPDVGIAELVARIGETDADRVEVKADHGAERPRERAGRRRFPSEPPPSAVLSSTRPMDGPPSYASIGDALRAAALEREQEERELEAHGEAPVAAVAGVRRGRLAASRRRRRRK